MGSLNENEKDSCREIAAIALGVDSESLPIGVPIPELNSVYYSLPGENGESVVACSDGGFLYSNSIVPLDLHVKAFRNGLRSSRTLFEDS